MLEVSLLGDIAIRLDGKRLTRFRSQKELALLAYLAHTGQTHSREAVADLLWEATSTTHALANLRTTIARLRKQVGDYLHVTRQTIGVTAVVHEQTDSAHFQAILTGIGEAWSAADSHRLRQGLELYTGEFMAGFYLADSPRFNDWLTIEQERLRQIALQGYRKMTGWQEKQGEFKAGIIAAQRWVSLDPLDEMAQQQLMRLLTFDGRASEALKVYENCRRLLKKELDVPPSPATNALYKAIRSNSLP